MSSEDYALCQNPLCFSCDDSELLNHLKSGYFNNFLNSKFNSASNTTVKLFGKIYATNNLIFTNMQQLFLDINKNFFLIRHLALESRTWYKIQSDINPEDLRMDIVMVLHSFVITLQKIRTNHLNASKILLNSSVENNKFKNAIIQLIKEIKNMLLSVGHLSSIPGLNIIKNFNSDTSKSAVRFYHYFHLCLDIWYHSTAILYSLHLLIPIESDEIICNFTDQVTPFLQLSSLLVYELTSLCISRFKESHIFSNSPFLCTCIKEFWIIIINMVDELNSEKSSFWGIYLSNLQIIVKSISSKSSSLEVPINSFSVINNYPHIQNPIEACLWLTSHIAPLYKYNPRGYFCDHQKAKSGYVVTKYLIYNLLSSPTDVGERCLRNSLTYCIELIKLWEPKADILLPLTDYYIKKIDGAFNIQGTDLSHFFKDSLSWLTYINNISSISSFANQSSFNFFLCILNVQLKLDNDHSLWRSLKGRIYTKFISKRIKEISEVGLQNSFSLFHIVAISGQSEIIDKICEIASFIETLADIRKQIISWKALHVLLHICQEKKYNAGKIIMLISKFFNSACSKYAMIDRNSTHKGNLMNLLLVHVDNTKELLQKESLSLEGHNLICIGFNNLLPACSVNETNYILTKFLNILQRIQKITESSKTNFVEYEAESIRILKKIFNIIYPFLESIALTATAPLVVSHIAGIFTKLAFDFSCLVNSMPQDFYKIFIYFTSKESINSNISCHYICFILDFPDLVDDIKLRLTDFDIFLIQFWVKCIVSTHIDDGFAQELQRKVLMSTLINETFPDVKILDFQRNDRMCVCITFFSIVATTFDKSDLHQKIKIAKKFQLYFKNYVPLVLNEIKKYKDSTSLVHVYKLTSHLVEHCSPVLHFPVNSERILLKILDQIIFPQKLFPADHALQSSICSSIKEYLPNYVKGLFKLDYRKDKSIEREIRSIFFYYINAFPLASNPLTKLVIDSVSGKPNSLTLDAHNFILEILKCRLQLNNVQNPINILQFFYEVFKLTPTMHQSEISNVLLKCAMEIRVRRSGSVSESVDVLIKKVLTYYKDKMELSHSKALLIPIIKWFIPEMLKWEAPRGFDVLHIYIEYFPHIMADIVPFLKSTVERHEFSRGSGADSVLRRRTQVFAFKVMRKMSEK